MRSISRRGFLTRVSGMALVPLMAEQPQTILYNGNIITVDNRQPRARAVAVAGGRFIAVGTNREIRALANARTKEIDLGGRTVVPGFIDAHSHPASAGRRHLTRVDCDLRSIAEIQQAIRARAARTPAGEWVLGFKYDDTKTSEGRFLSRDDLDAAAPDHPVFVVHRGGHSQYVNSLAYSKAGVTESTPDPDGGRFVRNPDTGKLNGRILERAAGAFSAVIPEEYDRQDYRAGVKLISGMLARAGITSVHDAYSSTADLQAYQDAREAGELLTRLYCLMDSAQIDDMIEAGVRTGFGDEWVRIGAMKATCDGSISERTARLSEPFIGSPDDYGIIVTQEAELYELARKAHEAGWQIGIHANGDVAIDITLGIYERLQREIPRRDPRFRLEHCTVINDSLVKRIAALGAIPTPFSTYVYFHGEKMRFYGEKRLNSMFAVRSFLDAGVMVTQTSDYPPGPFEPMMALQSSVTRTDMNGKLWGPDQRVSVEEAIRVGTLHGAYASYEENLKGSIEPGKLADLVVLGEDPTAVDPFTIIEIPVERTMVGGRWVWEA
ncbi:MAG: amidohydrolase [Candidatus Glassbacteria bacterium]|nr:amidohydrolase [Candidatus Glassbacteria bacterium]